VRKDIRAYCTENIAPPSKAKSLTENASWKSPIPQALA
jgi:hypothetical protein